MADKADKTQVSETIKIIIDRKTLFALASETRIKILKRLDKRRMTLTELSESLSASKSTMKEHLEKLMDAGLVRRIDEGRKWIYYELTEKGKKILHPDSLTRIILLLSIVTAFVGFVEVYKFKITNTSKSIVNKPTQVKPTQFPVPMPTRIPTHIAAHITHATNVQFLIGLALIVVGFALLLVYFKLK